MVRFAIVLVAALAGAVSAVGIGRDPGTLMAIRAGGDKPMEGLDSKCNKWHRVVKGDTCDGVVKLIGINLENFLKWNTKITKACKELFLGYDVCVGVSGTPAASGTNSLASKPPVSSSLPAPTSNAAASGTNSLTSKPLVSSSPPAPTSNAGSSRPAAQPSTTSSNGAQPSCKAHS
ncbi:hypothetical protein MY10362_007884 [Beauveria mimosiformis]